MIYFPLYASPCCYRMVPTRLNRLFEQQPYRMIAISPRQAEGLIVFGHLSKKMVSVLLYVYKEIPKPCCVIWVRGCDGLMSPYAMEPHLGKWVSVHFQLNTCLLTKEHIETISLQMENQ